MNKGEVRECDTAATSTPYATATGYQHIEWKHRYYLQSGANQRDQRGVKYWDIVGLPGRGKRVGWENGALRSALANNLEDIPSLDGWWIVSWGSQVRGWRG